MKNFLIFILTLSVAESLQASMSEYGQQIGQWLLTHPLSTAV